MTRVPVSELLLSDEGYDVLKDREGCELTAYQDTVGVWTIGLGHTSAAGPPTVTQGMTITEEEAESIFRQDAMHFRDECAGMVRVPMEQWEFDATASFIFNIGSTQFASSTFLARLNDEDYVGAAQAMLWFDQPPEIIPRRRGEYLQFTEGAYVARVDDAAWGEATA
jgi:lysozyme